jgi:hypothetical protein
VTELLEDWDPPVIRTVSERSLHSDRYMERVSTDIPGFLRTYFDFPNDGSQPLHIYNALERMFKGGRYVFQWATDHGKSFTGTFFFPIMSLAADPDSAHILLGANINDSRSLVQRAQRELETNTALIADFPWLKKPNITRHRGISNVTWTKTELTVSGRTRNNRNPSLYATTSGSSDVRGRRGKLIMDDIEGTEARTSLRERQRLLTFVQQEAITCIEDRAESSRPLLCAMGTPFDVDSIYRSLESTDWEVIKIPAYTVDYAEIHRSRQLARTPQGTWLGNQVPWQTHAAMLPDHWFTWPRKRDKIAENDPYFGAMMSKADFSIRYLLDPTAGDPTRLTLDQIRRLVAEQPEGDVADARDWLTLVSIDPSAGVGADYAGISVVKIRWPRGQQLPDVQVLHAARFTSGIIEQVDYAATLAEEYRCDVIYEINAQQGGNYANVFGHRHPKIRLLRHFTRRENKEDKEMGLTVVRSLVRQNKLLVPETELSSEGMLTLYREIRDLGNIGADDHLCASVWFVIRYLFDQVRLYNGPKLVTTMNGANGRSTSPNGAAMSWKSWHRR